MYTLNDQVLKPGQGFEDSTGKYYPSNWLETSTEAEKEAIGIVYTPDPEPTPAPSYDRRFYWGPDNPKDLTELKTTWIELTKDKAYNLLSETDWVVIRSVDPSNRISSSDIDAAVQTERETIRTNCATKESAIQDCTTVPELETYINSDSYTQW